MQLARPAIAQHPFRFGRGPLRQMELTTAPAAPINSDLKLFAATFLAGFVFVSVFLA